MSYRSYGDYDSNIPHKTFAGQARYLTQVDLQPIQNRIESLQYQVFNLHPQTFHCINNCPSDCSTAKDKALCMSTQKSCVAQCLNA